MVVGTAAAAVAAEPKKEQRQKDNNRNKNHENEPKGIAGVNSLAEELRTMHQERLDGLQQEGAKKKVWLDWNGGYHSCCLH